jgi:predicted Zn-dependent peptidase
MPFHTHTLPNGLTLIGETLPSARSVALGFFVRTGARDESAEVAGVSHFLEHMVFKGTPRRTPFDVNRDFDRIGADYNAYTSEENTVFHAAVLPEYLPEATDVLADILRPSLRAEDFDMEKKVIIEEIGRYEDNPYWSAFERAQRTHFAGHPLGNSVLGSVESITALKPEQMRAYFDRRYGPANITAVAAGRFDFGKFVDEVAKRCGGWSGGTVGRGDLREVAGEGGAHVIHKEKVALEYVIMLAPSPAHDSPMRYSADVLAAAVGDDSGSRLYWELIDPGLAESAGMGAHEYEAAGTYMVQMSCPPEGTAENVGVIRRVLDEVQRDGITDEELTQAKSKFASRLVRGNERPKGRMRSLGVHWLYQQQYHVLDAELRAYDAVTLDSVREVLERYPLGRATTIAYGPLTKL